ncbi:MAG TPA: AAA family ATPase, partial [Saprospiraceae bacterium]|nr:AAA family ATPase [Saprospiraceae bacterium]
MQKRLYPISHQDFPKLIDQGFTYIDKTHFAFSIVQRGGYYFLSRPRRFGKSLFISTLESIFQGKKELFEGLYIHDQWSFEEYPIIRIAFNTLSYENDKLEEALSNSLKKIAKTYQIAIDEGSVKEQFQSLIDQLFLLYNKGVVILIDEYDKPIIDYLNKSNINQALINRDVLKSFYSILKDADPYLKLVFITGVSKFSKVSIFSDLNNLKDLSLAPEYNDICGINQKELDQYFQEELKIYDREKIKEWYNGYRWDINGDSI